MSELKMDDSFVTFLSSTDEKLFENSDDLVTFGVSLEKAEDYPFPDGSYYSGQLLNGEKHGKGMLIWPDGTKYDGSWCRNARKGIGKFCSSDFTYHGNWLHDRKQGYGIESYSDGSVYSGYFDDGIKHGQGKQIFPNQSVYQGTWADNDFNG